MARVLGTDRHRGRALDPRAAGGIGSENTAVALLDLVARRLVLLGALERLILRRVHAGRIDAAEGLRGPRLDGLVPRAGIGLDCGLAAAAGGEREGEDGEREE